MYLESQIQLTISVPSASVGPAYGHLVLDELRNLVDICQVTVQSTKEQWTVWPLKDPTSVVQVYSYTRQNMNDWQQDKGHMLLDCACVEVTVELLTFKGKHRTITGFARIHDLRPIEFRDPELEIHLNVPRSCWNEIDVHSFVEVVQNACCTLGATYAAIDREIVCPNCISDAPFMYFSIGDNLSKLESYIPAVCWAQFLPFSRINCKKKLVSIEENIPNCRAVFIHHNDKDYAWIQFDESIWTPSMDARIAFRKHFRHSFPALNFQEIADHSKMHVYQEIIKWMPLFEEEKEQLSERLR